MELEIDFKNRRMPMGGPPATSLPLWGKQCELNCGLIQYNTPGRIEVHLQLDKHLIGVEMGLGRVQVSSGSDRLDTLTILPNSLYFVPAGAPLRVRKETPLEHVLIIVTPERLNEFAGEVIHPEYFFNAVDPSLSQTVGAVRRFFDTEDDDFLLVETLFYSVVESAIRRFGEGSSSAFGLQSRLTRRGLAQAISFVEDRLDQKFTLADWARTSVNLSPYHFAHAFKATTDQSPHQFVLQRRLTQARLLLEESGLPLAEIAYEAGFSSQSHMTAIFRRVLGMTPACYRRKITSRGIDTASF